LLASVLNRFGGAEIREATSVVTSSRCDLVIGEVVRYWKKVER